MIACGLRSCLALSMAWEYLHSLFALTERSCAACRTGDCQGGARRLAINYCGVAVLAISHVALFEFIVVWHDSLVKK